VRASAIAVVLVLAVARPAAATSCIHHAYETFDLRLTGVYDGKRRVKGPAAVRRLDRLVNSSDGGTSVLVWHEATMGHGKFYRLAQPLTPTPAVAAYIEATEQRTLRTGCGYRVPYRPVSPGRYVFEEEHSDGRETPRGLAEPELIVAPGRDVVELRFRNEGRRYRAVYEVVCAHFDWDKKEADRCAPSEPTPDLAAALASAPAPADADAPTETTAPDAAPVETTEPVDPPAPAEATRRRDPLPRSRPSSRRPPVAAPSTGSARRRGRCCRCSRCSAGAALRGSRTPCTSPGRVAR
jgi:hypothetical protein